MKNIIEEEKEDIYKAICDMVRCIPKGRVTSYGAIAAAVGLKSGARMVARAMTICYAARPKGPVHRVVSQGGILKGEHRERQLLLEKEGVKVEKDKVVDFAKLFWDPMKELHF